jgi:hypothetical protein
VGVELEGPTDHEGVGKIKALEIGSTVAAAEWAMLGADEYGIGVLGVDSDGPDCGGAR